MVLGLALPRLLFALLPSPHDRATGTPEAATVEANLLESSVLVNIYSSSPIYRFWLSLAKIIPVHWTPPTCMAEWFCRPSYHGLPDEPGPRTRRGLFVLRPQDLSA